MIRAVGETAVGEVAVGGAWELLLHPDGLPGAVNMALDQALLARAAELGTATLRLYRFAPACISFGRNEAATQHYDRAAIERRGIDVVRRPTGGGSVWHEHEVTYAVAAPIERFGSLRAAYRAIHQLITGALASLGADVNLASYRPSNRAAGRPAACFTVPLGGEIISRGRKLVGSAQLRRGDAFLQHGSILLDGTQQLLREVSLAPSQGSDETSLRLALGRPVSFREVADAIMTAWSGTAVTAAPALRAAAAEFRSPLWTWRR